MWLKLLWSIFGLLCSATLETVVSTDDSNNVLVSLYKSLFEGNYTSAVRPYCNAEAVNVKIDVGLREIVDLSEKQETIKLKIWVRLSWEDCYLTWNISEFGNISKLVVPYEKMWIPDVTLLEGINEIANMPDMKQYRTWISNRGIIQYHFPTTVHMTCGMNIAKFPFDYQMCTMTFGSWIHTNSEIEMFSKSHTGDLTSFINNQEWNVISLQTTKFQIKSSCCDEPFSSISYKLVIKRKATFYIITMIVPFVAFTILSMVGFVLPPNSSERIIFHVEILLAVTVFLLLIHETLPSSSESFPNIGIYFCITHLLTCVSCVMSAIPLYLFTRDFCGKHMPKWVSEYLVKGLGQLMRINSPTNKTNTKPQDNSSGATSLHNIRRTSVITSDNSREEWRRTYPLDFIENQRVSHDNLEETAGNFQLRGQNRTIFMETDNSQDSGAKQMNEWELLAYTLNRLFTAFYIVVTSINTVAFLSVISQNDDH